MEASERRRKALEALGVTDEASAVPFHHIRHQERMRKVRTFVKEKDFEPQQKKREYWSCKKKMRYATHGLATIAAARAFRARGVRLRVYDCRYCGGYHLTKKTKRGEE